MTRFLLTRVQTAQHYTPHGRCNSARDPMSRPVGPLSAPIYSLKRAAPMADITFVSTCTFGFAVTRTALFDPIAPLGHNLAPSEQRAAT